MMGVWTGMRAFGQVGQTRTGQIAMVYSLPLGQKEETIRGVHPVLPVQPVQIEKCKKVKGKR
jgi:hypothetical protein